MKGKKEGSDFFYGKNVYTNKKFSKVSHDTIIPMTDYVRNTQHEKLRSCSYGQPLVLYDGELSKINMSLSALIKAYYYIYVPTKKHGAWLLFSKNI